MKTKLVLFECKNYEITKWNPRDFKIGDYFWFSWCGITDIQEVTDENILAEVNGTLEDKSDVCIDFCYNFWRCVRKVIQN